jgi:hypothetical protein
VSGQDDIEERINRLLRRSDDAAINFVFSQLTIGITSCQIAKARRRSGTLNDSAPLRRAEKALRAAEKFMWRLKLQHPVFDQIMALVERLSMELDSLKRDPQSDDLLG